MVAANNPLHRWLFGQPLPTEARDDSLLPKLLALPTLSSDAISSVAYATQAILLVLGAAGLAAASKTSTYSHLTLAIGGAIVVLLAIVATSYSQTIYAYPNGGGSYIVSKENLGTNCGLIAGAALLIDYVLTVAVSVASGVQNLLATPLMQPYAGHLVAICVGLVVVLILVNLRGLKESGSIFAVPVYLFVALSGLTILLGLAGPAIGWTLHPDLVNQTIPVPALAGISSMTRAALLMLLLKAFANGCSAMTGVEAISNGVPAFQQPQSRNAAVTLWWMAGILAFLFAGISLLTVKLHVVYWEHAGQTAAPVIDQLSGAVYGKTGPAWKLALYYGMQLSTCAILVLAANTSFADFPRLASLLGRDSFMPRQLAHLGDRLVYSNGIVLLGVFAVILLVAFHGDVDLLIPLYAVGVFTAFTLSQSGMVRHWWRTRGRGWPVKLGVNGLGALATCVVLIDIVAEKWAEGAWIVVVLAGVLFLTFRHVHHYYAILAKALLFASPPPDIEPRGSAFVLVVVASLHAGILPALRYARQISQNCRAVHVDVDAERTQELRVAWDGTMDEVMPLVVLPSPYRSLLDPLLSYVRHLRKAVPDHTVTVIVPELVPMQWWNAILHSNVGPLLMLNLLNERGVIVTDVRYYVDDGPDRGIPAQHRVATHQPETTSASLVKSEDPRT